VCYIFFHIFQLSRGSPPAPLLRCDPIFVVGIWLAGPGGKSPGAVMGGVCNLVDSSVWGQGGTLSWVWGGGLGPRVDWGRVLRRRFFVTGILGRSVPGWGVGLGGGVGKTKVVRCGGGGGPPIRHVGWGGEGGFFSWGGGGRGPNLRVANNAPCLRENREETFLVHLFVVPGARGGWG